MLPSLLFKSRSHYLKYARIVSQVASAEHLQYNVCKHLVHTSSANSKAKSLNIGNPNFNPYFEDKLSVPRWKHVWLLMMKRKYEIEGEAPPQPRSNQFNWNYNAEISAFAARLGFRSDPEMLRIAFTEPLGDVTDDQSTTNLNNESLVQSGEQFTSGVIDLCLKQLLPKVPDECHNACKSYLISEDILSHIAGNLGYRDLVQSTEFPVTEESLKRCFLATIAAIVPGTEGPKQAAKFIADFVLTQLIGKDIVHDIWRPQNPMGMLVQEFQSRGLPLPEVRLTKQSGLTTVLPVYFVGIFSDQKLFVESGGETLIKAETDAAKLALKKLYDISVNKFIPRFDLLNDAAVDTQIQDLANEVDIDPLLPQKNVRSDEQKPAPSPTKKKGFFSRRFL